MEKEPIHWVSDGGKDEGRERRREKTYTLSE